MLLNYLLYIMQGMVDSRVHHSPASLQAKGKLSADANQKASPLGGEAVTEGD